MPVLLGILTRQLPRFRAKMERLWQKPLETWFPNGSDDPDLALLKVEHAEC